MDIPEKNPRLLNLGIINVLMGKNGCGKSSILREIDQQRQGASGLTKYITPERGGELNYDGGIETQVSTNPEWLKTARRRNSQTNFRQASVAEFRRLELLVLRTIEQDQNLRYSNFCFDETIKEINKLLDQIKIHRSTDVGFKVADGEDGVNFRKQMDTLSSGESELISLAVEILSFCYQVNAQKRPEELHLLLIDEPDVHLHPDLQVRLVKLIMSALARCPIRVVMATHSTAILGALAETPDASVAFMQRKEEEVRFRPISDALRRILPVFGAHPLSEVFNKMPILLVEGEDDERIWQSAVRSSRGKLRLWPCAAGDKQSLNAYEGEVEAVAGAIYDNPVAYSLRDRDDDLSNLDNKGFVQRMRLQCRAAENLIVSDDVLDLLGTSWVDMEAAIEQWLIDNSGHKQYTAMKMFKDGGYDRLNGNIKTLRNLLMERAGSNKPWEVAVGQAIAKLRCNPGDAGPCSLAHFLGPKLVEAFGLAGTRV